MIARRSALPLSTLLLLGAVACEADAPTAEELALLEDMQLAAGELPPSPTNRFADLDEAAALGRLLFFDPGLSATGEVACVDCHDPDTGFSDERERSLGTDGLPGTRHSMPVTTAALQPFLLWDGRADTAWRQPLHAIENGLEMDLSRVEVARFVAEHHRESYEAIFGPIPSLEGLPKRALPGDGVWETIAAERQDEVQRVFVNVGKAIEAYERRIVCADTRFDRWTRGEVDLTETELEGAALFVRDGCAACHAGPAFSDGSFHNLGLSREDAELLDVGREEGRSVLLADPLNGASTYSDDAEAGRARLDVAVEESSVRGAFRTASLRGVAQRARFGHLGAHTDLEEFIVDTYRRRGGRRGGGDGDGRGDGDGAAAIVGTLDPLLGEVNLDGGDEAAIATFLRTLDCPDVDPVWLAP